MMTKDVNFTSLWLILLLLAAMGGMSLYYQSTYGGVKEGYQRAVQELEGAARDIKEKDEILQARLAELEVAREREASLNERYTRMKREKEEMEVRYRQMDGEVQALRTGMVRLEGELAGTQDKLGQLAAENGRLKREIAILSVPVIIIVR